MNDEHKNTQQVYAAKDDVLVADQLIGTYMPFIKAETAKFLKRPPMEGHDDELSIAMIAFHEAIGGYSRTRGAFLKYAAMLIRSRLIDYSRREQRHSRVISLDAPVGEDDTTLGETLADERDPHEETAARDATRAEIEELTRQMQEFGVSSAMWRTTAPNSSARWTPAGKPCSMPGRTRNCWIPFCRQRGCPSGS